MPSKKLPPPKTLNSKGCGTLWANIEDPNNKLKKKRYGAHVERDTVPFAFNKGLSVTNF
jgi:hypothetical protein